MKFFTYLIETILLPPVGLFLFFKKKTRANFSERFALGNWSRLSLDRTKKTVWIHAASVGELTGVLPIIDFLNKHQPSINIVITCTSTTGRKRAKELADNALLLPIDQPFLISMAFSKIRPDIFLLFETELWPSLLYKLRKEKTDVIVVNGRISEHTFRSYKKFSVFYKNLFRSLGKIFVQTQLDQERFAALGANQDAISVSGSTKFDSKVKNISEAEKAAFFSELGLKGESPIFVAGSVRPGEDEQVIEAYLLAKEKITDLQMIIAPRHPEKFTDVAKLLHDKGILFSRRSSGVQSGYKSVLLLDTLGELSKAYSIASISFVGGTLVKIGGHNPMEPASYSVPVILGPYVSNIADAVDSLSQHEAYLSVSDTESLASIVVELLENAEFRMRVSYAACRAWRDQQGSTAIVGDYLDQLLRDDGR